MWKNFSFKNGSMSFYIQQFLVISLDIFATCKDFLFRNVKSWNLFLNQIRSEGSWNCFSLFELELLVSFSATAPAMIYVFEEQIAQRQQWNYPLKIELSNQILVSAPFEKLTLIVDYRCCRRDPITKPYPEHAFDMKIVSGAFAKKNLIFHIVFNIAKCLSKCWVAK